MLFELSWSQCITCLYGFSLVFYFMIYEKKVTHQTSKLLDQLEKKLCYSYEFKL